MQIADRVSLWGGKKSPLPPGARWVEYLESTGTQWIDTGTLVEMTDKVDCTFELTAYGNVTLAGARVDSSNYSLAIWAYTSTGRCIRFDLLSNGYGNVVQSITPTIGREYKVSKIGASNFVDGVRVNGNTSVAYAPVRTCYLFALNNGGTASFIGNCRIKSFSIGNKIKFAPIAIGTTGYMLDLVSGEYLPYGNKGTGEFIVGPDAPAMTGGGISAYA